MVVDFQEDGRYRVLSPLHQRNTPAPTEVTLSGTSRVGTFPRQRAKSPMDATVPGMARDVTASEAKAKPAMVSTPSGMA